MKEKPRIERSERMVIRYSGVNQAAKSLGVSAAHLSYILHGKRKAGRKLQIKMKKLGIVIPDIVAE